MDIRCGNDQQIDELKRRVLYLESLHSNLDIGYGFSACKSNDSSDTDAIVFRILQDILDRFNGDRTYIFEIDWIKRTHSCNFEIVNGHITSEMDSLKGLSLDEAPWWRDQIQNNVPIVIDDIDTMPPEAAAEHDVLRRQGIKSLMVMPLVSQGSPWGYIGIDMVKTQKHWSQSRVEWFESIASIINICMELKKSVIIARREKEQIKKLYDNMPVGFLRLKLMYDDDGNIVDYLHMEANPAVFEVTGIPSSEFYGKFGKETNKEDWENSIRALHKINESGNSASTIRVDATTGKHYNCTIYPIEQNDIVILFQDLTDVVKASTALRRSEETLKNLFKTLPVGVEIYDKEGVLIDINDQEREMFGFKDKESVIGVNLFENPLLPQTEIMNLKSGDQIKFDLRYDFNQIKQSSYYDTDHQGSKELIVRGTPIFDVNGQIENYLLVVVDNTESNYTHNKLNRFESLFNSIAKVSEIGIFQWDSDVKTFFGTPQWFHNLCQTPKMIGDIMEAHSLVHVDDKMRLQQNFDQMFAGKVTNFREEIRVHDGTDWKWLRCNFKVEETDSENKVTQIIGLNIDITELKHTEMKLIEAKSKAEESDRLKSAFVANMSHEIRTPLNAILGFSDLLIDTEDVEERKQYISIIRQNNDMLLQLISDILDISKIESGIIEVSTDTFDLNQLMEEIVISNGAKVHDGVVLKFDDKTDSCHIHTDKNRLHQVISNLIGNAIKFTPSGSISVGYFVEDDNVKIYVRDPGLGISDKQLPIIFSRFVKLNNFIHGTGLGLPICKSLVEKLGGKIWVESQLGAGSCFWFTIPHQTAKCSSSAEIASESISKQEPEQCMCDTSDALIDDKPLILIAEDTNSNYLLVSAILRNHYTLARAYNGLEAVNMFAEINPDIVLMDMKMPMMDGLEATANIRKSNQTTPIIAVTAFAFDSDKQAAFDAGCSDFVSKPINPEILKTVIKKWLNETRDYDTEKALA